MTRTIPPALYDEVFALVTSIAQPDAEPLSAVDETKASDAYEKLEALFKLRESSGESDPFLTEALADFTDDAAESIRLYKLALEQCADFPGEAKNVRLNHRPLGDESCVPRSCPSSQTDWVVSFRSAPNSIVSRWVVQLARRVSPAAQT
jgi:hypothetical protein